MKDIFLPYFAIGVSHVNKCPVIFRLTFLHSSYRSKVRLYIFFVRKEKYASWTTFSQKRFIHRIYHEKKIKKIIFVRHEIGKKQAIEVNKMQCS